MAVITDGSIFSTVNTVRNNVGHNGGNIAYRNRDDSVGDNMGDNAGENEDRNLGMTMDSPNRR